jgi:hypothetical protein
VRQQAAGRLVYESPKGACGGCPLLAARRAVSLDDGWNAASESAGAGSPSSRGIIPTVSELVSRMLAEYAAGLDRLAGSTVSDAPATRYEDMEVA